MLLLNLIVIVCKLHTTRPFVCLSVRLLHTILEKMRQNTGTVEKQKTSQHKLVLNHQSFPVGKRGVASDQGAALNVLGHFLRPTDLLSE